MPEVLPRFSRRPARHFPKTSHILPQTSRHSPADIPPFPRRQFAIPRKYRDRRNPALRRVCSADAAGKGRGSERRRYCLSFPEKPARHSPKTYRHSSANIPPLSRKHPVILPQTSRHSSANIPPLSRKHPTFFRRHPAIPQQTVRHSSANIETGAILRRGAYAPRTPREGAAPARCRAVQGTACADKKSARRYPAGRANCFILRPDRPHTGPGAIRTRQG